jgi:hypothetical protein
MQKCWYELLVDGVLSGAMDNKIPEIMCFSILEEE